MGAQEQYFYLLEKQSAVVTALTAASSLAEELMGVMREKPELRGWLNSMYFDAIQAALNLEASLSYCESDIRRFYQAHPGESFYVFRREHIERALDADVKPFLEEEDEWPDEI
jgi:hypothetical protein